MAGKEPTGNVRLWFLKRYYDVVNFVCYRVPELKQSADARMRTVLGTAEDTVSFLWSMRPALITMLLIAVNVAVFYFEGTMASDAAGSIDLFFSPGQEWVVWVAGGMDPQLMSPPGDWWRFIAASFVHFDLYHLLGNMVFLYVVGAALERVLGKLAFITVYFVSLLTNNLVTYGIGLLQATPPLSAGASDAVYGVIAASLCIAVFHRKGFDAFEGTNPSAFTLVVLTAILGLLYSLVALQFGTLLTHLLGMFGGVLGVLMVPLRSLNVPTSVRVGVALGWLALAAGALWHWGYLPF